MRQEDFANLALNNVNFICYIVDLENFNLLYINKPTNMHLANICDGSFLGQKCYKYLHKKDAPCEDCNNNYLVKGKNFRKEHYDKTIKKYYTHIDTLIEVDEKPAKLSTIYDPKLTSNDIEIISQKLTLEETLVSCIQTLVEDTDTNTSIQNLLSTVANYYGSNHAYVYELNHKENNVYKIYEYISGTIQPQININEPLPVELFEPFLEIFRKNGEITFNTLKQTLAQKPDVYKNFKYIHDNALLVPFSVEGKLTYCMGVSNPTKNIYELNLLHSVILFVVDKIRKHKSYKQLLQLSYSDILTGLWNRNKYNERLEELENTKINTFGYIHIGVNGLKKINQIYGEKFGDNILIQVADLLSKTLQTEIFRFEGNEFVAFFPHVTRPAFEHALATLQQKLISQNDFSLSLGHIYQEGKVDLRKGLTQAFDVMHAEKQKFYASQKDEVLQIRPNAVQIILNEIQSKHFTVYLQPKVNLLTGEISSAEALIRKIDAQGKNIPPDRFVPIYENEGTIRHIDFFVLEEVCKLLQNLIKENQALPIAVNFSRVTFIASNLVDEITKICAKYSVPHKYIKIEIAESIDKMDFEFFDKKLKRIKNAGFEISLDDFGAKHSNLLMLTMTEFSEVKIDKGLIDHITQSAQNRALVKNILKMISDLGTSSCVAEGIETKEQKDMIAEFGCKYGQGYYFYRPMPMEEFLLVYKLNLQQHIHHTDFKNNFITNITLTYNEMSAIIDAMPFSVSLLTNKNKLISCNNSMLNIFGLESKQEFVENMNMLSPTYQPSGQKSALLAAEHVSKAFESGYRKFPWLHKTRQGKEFSAEVTLIKLNVKGSEDSNLLAGFIREITPNIIDDKILEWTQHYGFNNDVSDKELITTLLDISGEWLWTFNYKTRQMMFFGEDYAELGLPREKFLFPETFIQEKRIYEDDMEEFMRACANLAKGEHCPSEMRFYLPDGTARYFRITYKILKDKEGNLLFAIGKVVDIDEQKKFSTLFHVDDLTQCYNKATTEILIEDYIQTHNQETHALFIFDIHNFKNINNTFGHTFGDTVLKNIVQDLYANFREIDIIGRIGGDEFLVFLKSIQDVQVAKDKMHVIEKLLTKEYSANGHNVHMTGSIGMSLYPKDGTDFISLYKRSESDMYQKHMHKKKYEKNSLA